MRERQTTFSLNDMTEEALKNYLKELWQVQLKIDAVGLQDDFLSLGAQSIDLFRMLTRIEHDFDCEFDFDAFFEDTRLDVLLQVLLQVKAAGAH